MKIFKKLLISKSILLALLYLSASSVYLKAEEENSKLPTILSMSPSYGPLEGDTLVTIFGTNFTGPDVQSVKFGETEAKPFWIEKTEWNTYLIKARTPSGKAGYVPVIITTTAGQSNLKNDQSYFQYKMVKADL